MNKLVDYQRTGPGIGKRSTGGFSFSDFWRIYREKFFKLLAINLMYIVCLIIVGLMCWLPISKTVMKESYLSNKLTAYELNDSYLNIINNYTKSYKITEEQADAALPYITRALDAVKEANPDVLKDGTSGFELDKFSAAQLETVFANFKKAAGALGFTLSASKNFYALNTSVKNGGWEQGKENITELFDIKIGVIGGGWAGKHYIKLLRNFYVDVLLYDPFISAEAAKALGAEKVELETLLKEADIVSIHAPSIPSTYHMINADSLKLMKKDAVLINTARGTIIDEAALYEHMKNGGLKYACIDVFDPEPPAKDNPLLTLDNVIVTPHLAGLARNGLKRIGTFVCEELTHFLNGETVRGEVTREMLARMA